MRFGFQQLLAVWLLSVRVVVGSLQSDLPPCSLSCFDEDVAPANSSSTSCKFAVGTDFEGTYSPCFFDVCSPKEALTALNVTSIICDIPVRDISVGMRAFVIVATVVSSGAIGARVILKFRSLAGDIGWDDLNIVIAVAVVLDAAVGQYLAAHWGLGRDAWKVPFGDLEKVFKAFYASTVGYKLGNMFTRMSVLCFYLRIFGGDDWFRRTTYGVVAINICMGISFVIVDIFQCKPISYVWNGWDGEHEGWCLDISVITWSHSILNIILDVATLAMAVWMIKGLQMKLRKKAAVIGLFVLGSAITIVTFLRLQALPPLKNHRNRTWALAPLAYWSAIEIGAGLILACLPALKKVRYLFRSKESITYTSNSASHPGSNIQRSGGQVSLSTNNGGHQSRGSRGKGNFYFNMDRSKSDITATTATELFYIPKEGKSGT